MRFGIISSERVDKSFSENNASTLELENMLCDMGYVFHRSVGFWDGVPERNFFVPSISKDVLLSLGNYFDQDAIVFGEDFESGVYCCDSGALISDKVSIRDHVDIVNHFSILDDTDFFSSVRRAF